MFVPIVTPPPSAQVQELGQRLYETANQYRTEHPGIDSIDVSEAFKIGWALFRSGSGMAEERQRPLLAVMVGIAVAGVAMALFMTGGFPVAIPGPAIIVLVVLGFIGVATAIQASKAAEPGAGSQKTVVVVGLVLLLLAGLFFLLSRSGGGPLG